MELQSGNPYSCPIIGSKEGAKKKKKPSDVGWDSLMHFPQIVGVGAREYASIEWIVAEKKELPPRLGLGTILAFWANHLHAWVSILDYGSEVWVQLGNMLDT